ncbi:hypothetical protein FC21_GL000336 [Limosilactobacillus equigenerosi DSM 18793 = JCM 14505]|uniref:Type II CBASS E2 protein domain-containing protein n=2 Tax=Limosilactobacillus TaxID=2742598 RepID=A0A0R1UT58_9LACO|nr:hypothetical protein FC21_GL000336 [Limosilactobacillus equigenerosi DSM 18793 = JCM 14505]
MMVKVSSDLFDGEYKVKFTLFEKKRPQITVYDSEITTDKVEKIPHIFKKYSIPGEVRICLYYNGNGKREYGNDMDFLKTLFPWTLEWIYFYQLFKETGKWYGGGI